MVKYSLACHEISPADTANIAVPTRPVTSMFKYFLACHDISPADTANIAVTARPCYHMVKYFLACHDTLFKRLPVQSQILHDVYWLLHSFSTLTPPFYLRLVISFDTSRPVRRRYPHFIEAGQHAPTRRHKHPLHPTYDTSRYFALRLLNGME